MESAPEAFTDFAHRPKLTPPWHGVRNSVPGQRGLMCTLRSPTAYHRLATGVQVEIVTWLDDCTRYALP